MQLELECDQAFAWVDPLQLDRALRTGSQSLHISLFFASLTLNLGVLLLLLLVPAVGVKPGKPLGAVPAFFAKGLSFYSLCFASLLLVPFVQLTAVQLFCLPRAQVFSGSRC